MLNEIPQNLIIDFDVKRYFFFNNSIHQTDNEGHFYITNKLKIQLGTTDPDKIKEFLYKHELFVDETTIKQTGGSGYIILPKNLVNKKILFMYTILE